MTGHKASPDLENPLLDGEHADRKGCRSRSGQRRKCSWMYSSPANGSHCLGAPYCVLKLACQGNQLMLSDERLRCASVTRIIWSSGARLRASQKMHCSRVADPAGVPYYVAKTRKKSRPIGRQFAYSTGTLYSMPFRDHQPQMLIQLLSNSDADKSAQRSQKRNKFQSSA